MQISETKQQVVGAMVFAGLLAVIGLTYGAGTSAATTVEEGSYQVTAAFNRIDGLTVGDDVMMGGVRIGEVVAAGLTNNFRANLVLQLTDDIPVPYDTSAAIHTDGLFGGKHVALEPGGDEQMLKQGDVIEFTQDAVVVSDLLDLIISQGRARLAAQNAE